MMKPYSHDDLVDWLHWVAAGYTFDHAAQLANLDQTRFRATIADSELRTFALIISSIARAKIEQGHFPIPARDDDLYDHVDRRLFFNHLVDQVLHQKTQSSTPQQ